MTALHASGLGKRYRQRWALSDCTLQIPEGRVAGLVGPHRGGQSNLVNRAPPSPPGSRGGGAGGPGTPARSPGWTASPAAARTSWPRSVSWLRTPRSTPA